jgi:hypothetical protein
MARSMRPPCVEEERRKERRGEGGWERCAPHPTEECIYSAASCKLRVFLAHSQLQRISLCDLGLWGLDIAIPATYKNAGTVQVATYSKSAGIPAAVYRRSLHHIFRVAVESDATKISFNLRLGWDWQLPWNRGSSRCTLLLPP